MTAKNRSQSRITIGLCVKNSEKTIKECLESILDQEYPAHLMEIIIVDGGSQDNTTNIIMNLISSSNVIARFFCDEGKGLATARQIVLDNAKSDYIVWVDSDVLLSANFVMSQVKFMQSRHGISVAIGKFDYRKGIQKTLPAQLQSLSKYVGAIEWARSRKRRGLPPNDASVYLVKASKQVGGFDKTIKGASEDEDIISRMKAQGWLIAINERAKFYAFSRETWQALWAENIWFGYGNHFLSHKNKGINFFLRYLPLVYVYVGLKEGFKSYKLTLEKKSFLLPILSFFCTTSLLYGFIRAHQEGYGHKEKREPHSARVSEKKHVALDVGG